MVKVTRKYFDEKFIKCEKKIPRRKYKKMCKNIKKRKFKIINSAKKSEYLG
jgi:hypothetical protein